MNRNQNATQILGTSPAVRRPVPSQHRPPFPFTRVVEEMLLAARRRSWERVPRVDQFRRHLLSPGFLDVPLVLGDGSGIEGLHPVDQRRAPRGAGSGDRGLNACLAKLPIVAPRPGASAVSGSASSPAAVRDWHRIATVLGCSLGDRAPAEPVMALLAAGKRSVLRRGREPAVKVQAPLRARSATSAGSCRGTRGPCRGSLGIFRGLLPSVHGARAGCSRARPARDGERHESVLSA
jgi:hypothetical protein